MRHNHETIWRQRAQAIEYHREAIEDVRLGIPGREDAVRFWREEIAIWERFATRLIPPTRPGGYPKPEPGERWRESAEAYVRDNPPETPFVAYRMDPTQGIRFPVKPGPSLYLLSDYHIGHKPPPGAGPLEFVGQIHDEFIFTMEGDLVEDELTDLDPKVRAQMASQLAKAVDDMIAADYVAWFAEAKKSPPHHHAILDELEREGKLDDDPHGQRAEAEANRLHYLRDYGLRPVLRRGPFADAGGEEREAAEG
jgi:hypothetical protein